MLVYLFYHYSQELSVFVAVVLVTLLKNSVFGLIKSYLKVLVTVTSLIS